MIWRAFVFAFGLLAAAACAGAPEARHLPAPGPPIVFVHGAFEDASGWAATRALLEAEGYRTTAVTLPGRPSFDGEAAPSLEAYRDEVIAALSRFGEPVILVGHSFGGMTISAVAEAAPEKVRTLVYLAAYLPVSGQALTDLSRRDAGSGAGAAFRVDPERGIASIAWEARAGLFCNDCPPDLAAALPGEMVDEPLGPLATPVMLSAERFGRTDKVYIRTRRDLVVSPALQDEMLRATPVRAEITLDTGHTPFRSDPVALSEALLEVIAP